MRSITNLLNLDILSFIFILILICFMLYSVELLPLLISAHVIGLLVLGFVIVAIFD
jgi:hypothetical protein